jgi:hypothetical protein
MPRSCSAGSRELAGGRDRRNPIAEQDSGTFGHAAGQQGIRRDDESACPPFAHECEGGFVIAFRTHLQNVDRDSKLAGGRFEIAGEVAGIGFGGVDDGRHFLDRRHRLMQQLQSLGVELVATRRGKGATA